MVLGVITMATTITAGVPGKLGSADGGDAGGEDGRKTRWNAHRDARAHELAVTIRKLVHRAGPDVSMDDIASECATSKSVLYRYFTDRRGVQAAVAELVIEHIGTTLRTAQSAAREPRAALEAMVDAYLAIIDHSPHVYAFVMDGNPGLPFARSVVTFVAEPLERVRADSGARQWAAGAVGFIHACGQQWLGDIATDGRGGDRDAERAALASRITQWLWHGAATDSEPATRRS